MSDAFDLDDMPSFGQRPRRQRRSAPWANGLSFGAEPENEEQEIETDQSDLEKIAGGPDRLASVRTFAERPPAPSPLADQLKQDAQTLDRGQDGEDFQKSVRALQRIDGSFRQAVNPKIAPAEVLPDPLKTPNLPYLSTEQLRRDIAADGYRKDAQVRQAVAEKLQRSALFGRDPVIAPEPTPSAQDSPIVKALRGSDARAITSLQGRLSEGTNSGAKRPDGSAKLKPAGGRNDLMAFPDAERPPVLFVSGGGGADGGWLETVGDAVARVNNDARATDQAELDRWREIGAAAFAQYQPRVLNQGVRESGQLIEQILQSGAFAARVRDRLEDVRKLREQLGREDGGDRETGEPTGRNRPHTRVEWTNLEPAVLDALNAWRRDQDGSGDTYFFDDDDWARFAVETTVDELAHLVTWEGLRKRNWARYEGVYDVAAEGVEGAAKTVDAIPSSARALTHAVADGIGVDSKTLDAILATTVIAEARLTNTKVSEIILRDREVQHQFEQAASAVLTQLREVRDHPALVVEGAEHTVNEIAAEIDRLRAGPALREQQRQDLVTAVTAGDMDAAAYLERERALTKEAVTDFIFVASVVTGGVGAAASVLRGVDFGDWGDGFEPEPALAGGRPPGPKPANEADASHTRDGMVYDPNTGRYARRDSEYVRDIVRGVNAKEHEELVDEGLAIKSVPEFKDWMGRLSYEDVIKIWQTDGKLWGIIEQQIRTAGGQVRGGQHEWFMISMTADLLDIGISVDELLSLSLRTSTDKKIFKIPEETIRELPEWKQPAARGERFSHLGGTENSGPTLSLMHQELAKTTAEVRKRYREAIKSGITPEKARESARQMLYDEIGDIAEAYVHDQDDLPLGLRK